MNKGTVLQPWVEKHKKEIPDLKLFDITSLIV